MSGRSAAERESFSHIVSHFSFSSLASALWSKEKASALESRNLGLAQASEETLSGRHVRAAGLEISTTQFANPQAGFAFVIVLAGHVTLTEPGKPFLQLEALDSLCRFGTGEDVSWSFSRDAEVLEVVALPRQDVLGSQAREPGLWRINREREESYIRGDGPRAYFEYRDLGVNAATGGRIHIHIVRSTRAMEGGTGWHLHSMGQLFYVLRGWADLLVEHQKDAPMKAGDAMCLGKFMRHNVPAFSDDYLVLEMCIPADYDTLDTDPPV